MSREVDSMIRRRAFGQDAEPDPVMVGHFRRAGFCQEDAEQGARLMESGRYAGFEDVALSLGTFDPIVRQRNLRVTRESIEEAAKMIDPAASDAEKLVEKLWKDHPDLARQITESLKAEEAGK